MPKKKKPKAASDGDTRLTPITPKERRKIDKSIKKKYDRLNKPRHKYKDRPKRSVRRTQSRLRRLKARQRYLKFCGRRRGRLW